MKPYVGTVKSGAVMLPPDAGFEEGQQVEITPAGPSPEEDFMLREAIGSSVGSLPNDLAINHDYYLHGLRKQQPRLGRWIRSGMPGSVLTDREASEYTDALVQLAAETRNLPADLSSNHDHYLHGVRKR